MSWHSKCWSREYRHCLNAKSIIAEISQSTSSSTKTNDKTKRIDNGIDDEFCCRFCIFGKNIGYTGGINLTISKEVGACDSVMRLLFPHSSYRVSP